jgi:restriction endonuclease Mrr
MPFTFTERNGKRISMRAGNKKTLYFRIANILKTQALHRREIIDKYIIDLGLTKEELADKSTAGKANIQRSVAGAAINEMLDKGILLRSADGVYSLHEQMPVMLRNEKIEKQLLTLLADRGTMTKSEMRRELTAFFGTQKTLTEKDDQKLFAGLSDILRRLTRLGVITNTENGYSLPDRIEAKIGDINEMLTLKESFITKLYKRGGEYFEVYFMTLLGKFLEKNGKTILSNSTTGGSADGGIDGIIETRDCLGFKETIMVQTKNRSDKTNETTVRGFYGAVCARQGSRGIFATTSDFHEGALAFLETIDNCVGVDGNMIFKMACKVHYGIKKCSTGKLIVDTDII